MRKIRNKGKKTKKLTGILSKNRKGFGFVKTEELQEDVFIAPYNMEGAMDGDKVTVEVQLDNAGVQSGRTQKRDGRIEKVLDRKSKEIVGTLQKEGAFGFLIPIDRRISDQIFIKKEDLGGAHSGDKVVAEIRTYPMGGKRAEGFITEIISRFGAKDGEIKALIRQYNVADQFNSQSLEEAERAARQKIEKNEVLNRVDLTKEKIFTIDGAKAKDFDDGVSCSRLENGNYRLGVHIADVTHYVREESSLDEEALMRSNSIYLIDKVIPMLPPVLSNGICSLNPKEKRLTLTCSMEIDERGEVVSHEIYKSVIKSCERLIYDDVSDLIEGKGWDEKYDYISEDILMMSELAEILRNKRQEDGSLDFDLEEAEITLDSDGVPISIEPASRRVANRLIEEFMLLANRVVAEHFFDLKAPVVYRVHEKPELEKILEFQKFLRGFAVNFPGNEGTMRPKDFQKVLASVEGKSYEKVVNTVMLRAMQKAVYEPTCKGHFGLSFQYYCHFTSPIRRYADLMTHRTIKSYLEGSMDEDRHKKYTKQAEVVSMQTSEKERISIELEREVEKIKKAEYMSQRVGESFKGIISGVTNFGLFVELPNTIEGLLKVETLNDDYYQMDKEGYRLVGNNTRRSLSLGDEIDVYLESVDVPRGEINFAPKNGKNTRRRKNNSKKKKKRSKNPILS